AQLMLASESLQMEPAALQQLDQYFSQLIDHKHKYFGNARTIRKIVQETIRRQNLRMADLPAKERSPELIGTVKLEDISDFRIMEEEIEPRKGIGFR
ncbi:MAG: stage V sporulation protein K, partial [Bacteroidota bacterium]